MTALPIGFSRQGVAALLSALPSAMRRLVAASDDPAKRRIREWLANLGDERLSGLGLTPQDILVLRGGQGPHPFSPLGHLSWRAHRSENVAFWHVC